MRGMILAAGRGARMQNLTDNIPKPLLCVGKNYLIEYSIYAMKSIGIKEIVVNVSYKKEQIKKALGDGSKHGISIIYSEEDEALETGGGILKALPKLGNAPFLVLSSDVIFDYDLKKLPFTLQGLAHIVLIKNPEFNILGDFNLKNNFIECGSICNYTYANIGIYHPDFFSSCKPGKFGVGSLLKDHAKNKLVTGEIFSGFWSNVGTSEQLDYVNNLFNHDKLF
ncbi:nucleotidyltransferase family protein [Gammaproteobacteria bacterium]|nr:nucleotidyltransferase family protein [Gammaproteobacteria bacterium]